MAKKSGPTAEELRRAGERAKRAVRRAVLHDDFRALDRSVFEGWVAAQYACTVFGRLVEKEEVRGGPIFHPLMNRWRLSP